jgi:multidrug transporter EmrE-like cation transporter
MSYAWYDFVGNIGVALILIAYLFLTLEKLDPKSVLYSILNGLGALLILVSLYFAFNLSSFIIELAWLLISMIGLIQAIRYRLKS